CVIDVHTQPNRELRRHRPGTALARPGRERRGSAPLPKRPSAVSHTSQGGDYATGRGAFAGKWDLHYSGDGQAGGAAPIDLGLRPRSSTARRKKCGSCARKGRFTPTRATSPR